MCNLYNLKVDRLDFDAFARAAADPADRMAVEKDYAAPGKPGHVIREVDGQRVLSSMIWGFPGDKRPRKTAAKPGQSPWIWDKYYTNARNLRLGLWKPWVSSPAHRCLVPFTSFAEPKDRALRTAPGDLNWWFSVPDQPIACFAGIWKHDPDHGPVYAFLTCDPNPLVAPLHPKAMPVILLAEDHDRWLRGSADEALAMQAPFPSQLMGVV